MGDKPSTSQSSVEDVVPTLRTFWRRTSGRLAPVEVVDRGYLLRRPLRDVGGEPPTAADPEGPTPPKRERRDQSQTEGKKGKKQKQANKEKDKEREKEMGKEKKKGKEDKDKDDPYECPLCLENVRPRKPVTTKCGHIFCQECLETALRKARKCPMCNARVKQHPFIRIYM